MAAPLRTMGAIEIYHGMNEGGSAMLRTMLVGCFCFALAASDVIAQVPVPRTPVDAKVSVTIALEIGSESYKYAGPGTCRHALQASIYDMPAEQWTMEGNDGLRNVTLTLWQPKQGAGKMVSFAVNAGGKTHVVNTVKVGGRGNVQGSGTAALAPAGNGGTFTIDATAADGAKISGTIKCDAFLAPAPVAGD
jgi:hypothetical protein